MSEPFIYGHEWSDLLRSEAWHRSRLRFLVEDLTENRIDFAIAQAKRLREEMADD